MELRASSPGAVTATDYTQIAECRSRNLCICLGCLEETTRRLTAGFLPRYVYKCRIRQTWSSQICHWVFKFILTHPELFMLKGISYTWSSVRSFHVHITKQGGAVSPGMVRCGWNSPSLNTRTYVRRPPLARPPRPLLLRARSRTRIKKIGVVRNGRTLVIAIRKKTLIPRDTNVVSILKTVLCFIVPSAGILSRQHFDKAFPCHTPLSRTSYRTMNLWTLPLERIH